MKKVSIAFFVVCLLLVVACSGFDVTVHKKNPAQRAAKLRKKAAKLERQAVTLTEREQTSAAHREVINAVNAAGKTILNAVDIRTNCRTAGEVRLHDVTIGGNCTTAGDARLEQVTISGNLKTAGDASISNIQIVGNCMTAGDAKIDTASIGGYCMTSGDATLKDVVVAGNLIASGAVMLRDCQLKQAVDASGAAIMVHAKINGDMSIAGNLKQFENCSCKALVLYPKDDSTTLIKSSSMASITVKHKSSSGWSLFGFKIKFGKDCHKAAIVLDNSTVYGNIVFEDVEGTVIVRNGAQVTGQVIGGRLLAE